jgi:hypothetical protein
MLIALMVKERKDRKEQENGKDQYGDYPQY